MKQWISARKPCERITHLHYKVMATIYVRKNGETYELALGEYDRLPLTSKGLLNVAELVMGLANPPFDGALYRDYDDAMEVYGEDDELDAILQPIIDRKYAAVVYDVNCPGEEVYLTESQVRDGVEQFSFDMDSVWVEGDLTGEDNVMRRANNHQLSRMDEDGYLYGSPL